MRRCIGRTENIGNNIKLVTTLLVFTCINGCTTGSAVVTGQERSPIDPAAVTLYVKPPAEYEVVGIVEAATDVNFINTKGARERAFKAAQERVFAELKEQAASIGANGVIDWEVGEIKERYSHYDPNTGMSYPKEQITKTVRGTAIFVASSSRSK